jgi:hypothetical protein
MESDSKIVIDVISFRQIEISKFRMLISHIKPILLANSNFKVKFVGRQMNTVAFSLARVTYFMFIAIFFELYLIVLKLVNKYQ